VKLRVRLLLYTLCATIGSVWLSVAAVLATLASGKPRFLIEVAYWPTRLCGTPPNHYMNPSLVAPILVNALGWAVLANLVALAHHGVVRSRDRVAL
jgi:hypothetical protein